MGLGFGIIHGQGWAGLGLGWPGMRWGGVVWGGVVWGGLGAPAPSPTPPGGEGGEGGENCPYFAAIYFGNHYFAAIYFGNHNFAEITCVFCVFGQGGHGHQRDSAGREGQGWTYPNDVRTPHSGCEGRNI